MFAIAEQQENSVNHGRYHGSARKLSKTMVVIAEQQDSSVNHGRPCDLQIQKCNPDIIECHLLCSSNRRYCRCATKSAAQTIIIVY
ncbi:hypothetical protein DPMN_148295 [Dreissena polymorpha]|uniref:Uncharacterized protein n=1 Tax=Dreissena polymorpha TaxID=45954 RepID=A0A9D4FAK6_DREPO|nr:hypothetical protein DPMN_148295 [Dreissena polymorpha]